MSDHNWKDKVEHMHDLLQTAIEDVDKLAFALRINVRDQAGVDDTAARVKNTIELVGQSMVEMAPLADDALEKAGRVVN